MSTPQRVFVVMGNDYPDAVFAKWVDASTYCDQQNQKPIEDARKIHWRVYSFDLQQIFTPALGQGARSGEGKVSRSPPRDQSTESA